MESDIRVRSELPKIGNFRKQNSNLPKVSPHRSYAPTEADPAYSHAEQILRRAEFYRRKGAIRKWRRKFWSDYSQFVIPRVKNRCSQVFNPLWARGPSFGR